MKLKTTKEAILDLSLNRILPVILGLGLLAGGCSRKHEALSFKNSEIAGQLKEFAAEKAAQANAAASAEGKELLPEYKTMLAAAGQGDWLTISNTFRALRKRAPQYEHSGPNDTRLSGTAWEGAKEIWGAYDFFAVGGEKFFVPLGKEIIASIPQGSIYFGGTDMGRFLITAMVKSQVNGDPFFVLTQNAMADNTYLAYLRSMYGGKIYTPTDEDSKSCFDEYMTDVRNRLDTQQLKPGEQVHEDHGRLQVSGQTAVMLINGLIAKVIFDKNPDREFYVEESFPLQWMYPHLEPHGLILKLNRQPLSELSEGTIQEDHDYWVKFLNPLIGDWLKDDTSVQDVCAFAEKVPLKHNLSGFKGDPEFVQNDMAKKALSKLRSSIAGVYAWRLGINGEVPAQYAPTSEAERQRLANAADIAYRQALALCPDSPEVVYRYVNFLTGQQRIPDALLVVETASHLDPKNRQWRDLVAQLKK